MENEAQLPSVDTVLPGPRRTSLDQLLQNFSIVQSPTEELSSDPIAIRMPTDPHAVSPQDVYPEHEPESTMDEEVSLDGSDDTPTTTTRVSRTPNTRWFPSRVPTIPLLWKNILKCSVAYFIGSLFTFHPSLSRLFGDLAPGSGGGGPYPSAHMIATIAVYYNPAKTIGGMFEADSYCLVAWLYSALMSLSGLSLFWWLDLKPGFELVADFELIIWVGLTIWGLTWMKVWMSKPTFNSACSMSATVAVREGTWETLLAISSIVLVGIAISNLVCFSLWPQSATYNLQVDMTKTLDSYATLLGMITNTFLLEEPIRKPSHGKMQRAVENHQSSFTSLKKSLAEARSEWFGILGEQERVLSKQAYGDAVDSLTRLAQHLNGLRSGTRLQYELSKAQRDGKLVLRRSSEDGHAPAGLKGKTRYSLASQTDELEEALLRAAADMFGDLVDDVGPPFKALSNACTSCLKRLREAFVNSQNTEQYKMMQPQDFHKIIDGIDRALFTFESTSNHALLRLYRRSNFASDSVEKSAHSSLEDQLLTESEHEHIFLVYFFIFTLQEFAGELMSLTDAMRRIYAVELARFTRQNWFKRYFINGPKSFLSCIRSFRRRRRSEKTTRASLRRISTYFNADERHPKVSFPKVRPHAPNTLQTPDRSNLTSIERFLRSLWDLGDQLRDRNINYSFKVGMSTALLAAPAFFDATRPIFTEYRGEWALMSCFVVMSPTIGATNFLGVHRALGTLYGKSCTLGAVVAAGIYSLFPENGVVLSIFGFFFSLPCFYYIVANPEYATSGRFVLLTYNLTCLYAFNIREDNVPVLDIAYHRSASVTVGVIWALIASRLWWPSEARRELSKALGEFCLNIGWLYTRLVASNSGLVDYFDESNDGTQMPQNGSQAPDENTPLLSKSASAQLSSSIQEFMAMELHLQIKLIELQGLLAQTQHEPRLKGPFPILLYRSILTSLQTILDKLHSMRCVTTREEWCSVRKDFILPVNKERREMVGNIILYFSTLASAFRLKAPLPPYLPPAEKARERLVDAIRKLDVVKNRQVHGSRQLLFFAYALTMKGVTQELEYLGHTLQDAFGAIGQSAEEFDGLFAEELPSTLLFVARRGKKPDRHMIHEVSRTDLPRVHTYQDRVASLGTLFDRSLTACFSKGRLGITSWGATAI
ncbi:hypothetical protein OG21DRAFT_1478462 [Imleria badia]|nr:hypothetical protein OG21DRAFT_1478462 [Imleria badia]